MNVFWTDIESRFLKLHEEQLLSRTWFLHAFDCNGESWDISGGTDTAKKNFQWVAAQGALRRGAPQGKDPVSFWLDLLKKESPHYRGGLTTRGSRRRIELDTEQMCSIEYENYEGKGGVIELLCKASAEYCVHCDAQEQSERRELTSQTTAENQGSRGFAENSDRTPNSGEPSQKTRVALPATWDELQRRGSISQQEAAQHLQCSRKTIGRRVAERQLKQSTKGRIVCDDLLRIEIRKVHGQHVLR